MKNFTIKDSVTEKRFWISRSIAVSCVIAAFKPGGELYFLMEKRGPGCPDNVGKYVFPCGYVDFSETLKGACTREVYEEAGLKINKKDIHFVGINDGPTENRQNITIRYVTIQDFWDLSKKLASGEINGNSESRGGEKGEIAELSLKSYSWVKDHRNECAFDHDKLADMFYQNVDKIRTDQFYWDGNTDYLKNDESEDPDKLFKDVNLGF